MKKVLAAMLCLMMILMTAGSAGACTAVYVGGKVSADGTTIIAKSNDYPDVWGNYVTITERVENEPGRVMPVDNEATVFAELPATTYRYTSTPFMDSAGAVNGLGSDATVCANEYGVVMIMSITSFSNAAVSVSEPYARNQAADQAGIFDTVNYPYYRFKELATLCVEPDDCPVYGAPVRGYWHDAETVMIRSMEKALRSASSMDDPDAARQFITYCCNVMQEKAFSDAGQLLNDVRWTRSRNSNTMKNGRNPETHDVLDELRVLPPMEIRLDVSAWEKIMNEALSGALAP